MGVIMGAAFRLVRAFACAWMVCGGLAATALGLPIERHYEMVSPVFKGGLGATYIEGVAPDGESVAYYSGGTFANAPNSINGLGLGYLGRRTGSGWSTVPLMPPASLIAEPLHGDFSPSLDVALGGGKPGTSSQNPRNEEDFLLHPTDMPDTSAYWELAGAVEPQNKTEINIAEYETSSVEFCHLLLSASGSDPLLQAAVGANKEIYEFDRGCGGAARSLVLVGLNNKESLINPACWTTLGGTSYALGGADAFNAMSADGAEVFFTVCLKTEGPQTGPELPHQVFVRLGESRTLEVSRPLGGCVAGGEPGEVPCNGAAERASADFAGASTNGATVYFTAPLDKGQSPLVPGDIDSSNNLYMATIGCAASSPECAVGKREVISLAQASHDPISGQAADVQGVVRVAPDGSRAYFVAGGDLIGHTQQEALESKGRQVPHVGAKNLYLYNSASPESIAFIGDLCSGAQRSGTVEDVYCPSETGVDEALWTKKESQAQTAGADGRFLVFTTYAQLTGSDTNVVPDIYRYDAATGQLARVSGGENGYDDNGNRAVPNESGEPGASIAFGHYGPESGHGLSYQYEMGNRAIGEDGSRIVFRSAAPLSPAASNGLQNAYEWHASSGTGEGNVSLVSSGGSVEPIKQVVISPDGSSVLFDTVEGLVPQDKDGADDIYDARLGAGFAPQPAERRPCEGDACQGPLTNPAPLLVPGSVSQMPGGNFAPPAPVKVKPKAKVVKCGKGHVRKKGKCVKATVKRKVKKSSHGGTK